MTSWQPPSNTAGLIFDCDGTLADTMPAHFQAWTTVLGRVGIPFSESRFYELGGMPTARIIRLLSEESGVAVANVDHLVHLKEESFLTFLTEIRQIEPVVSIAKSYRGRLPMAVASGGYRSVIQRTLSQIGILEWFETLVCAEDTEKHKPEPDVFLEAARRLKLDPEQCIVFEDTDIGLEAARRAGIPSVDVRSWYLPA